MDPVTIATILVTALRAGTEFAPILAELRGQATPEEWSKIMNDLDAAVAGWKAAPGPA
jgi:hypothetical protein